MNPNPLSDREKALENQWIREKEYVQCVFQDRKVLTWSRKQMAKDRAAKAQSAKDSSQKSEQAGKDEK